MYNRLIKYLKDLRKAFRAVREDEFVQGTYYLDITLRKAGEDIETFILRAYKENLGEYRKIEVGRKLNNEYAKWSNIFLTGIV